MKLSARKQTTQAYIALFFQKRERNEAVMVYKLPGTLKEANKT